MVELKNYFDNKYSSKRVSVADGVMERIAKSKWGGIKAKYIVIAASLILLVGFTYTVTQLFYGPDGEIVWKISQGTEEGNFDKVNDVFESLSLEEGDIVHIMVKENNPENIMSEMQKPWRVEKFDECKALTSKIYSVELEEAYHGFDYRYSDLHSLYNQKSDSTIMNEVLETQNTEEAIVKISKGKIEDVTSFKHIYQFENNQLEIIIHPWLGNEIFTFGDKKGESKTIEINGYEGLLKTHDELYEFVIIKDETYIAVRYPINTLTNSQLIEILELWIH